MAVPYCSCTCPPFVHRLPCPGIVANNASGMCCGVANNTYNTLDHMRIVLVDGTVLDTADEDSCQSFLKVRGWAQGGVGLIDMCRLVHLVPSLGHFDAEEAPSACAAAPCSTLHTAHVTVASYNRSLSFSLLAALSAPQQARRTLTDTPASLCVPPAWLPCRAMPSCAVLSASWRQRFRQTRPSAHAYDTSSRSKTR